MKKKSTSLPSHTDWQRLKQMRDEDIDFSDLPEIPPEDFAHALVRKGLEPIARKSQITLRIDADVLEWFRAKGVGYQSQMNAVLKAYREAHRS